jgi:hypothetical protein
MRCDATQYDASLRLGMKMRGDMLLPDILLCPEVAAR